MISFSWRFNSLHMKLNFTSQTNNVTTLDPCCYMVNNFFYGCCNSPLSICFSCTLDFHETVVNPCEPLQFGHILVKEQLTPACHHQTNGFTLSRPRDFISALTKEGDSSVGCRSGNKPHNVTIPGENLSSSLRDQSSTQAQANCCNAGYTSADGSLSSTLCRRHLSTEAEDQSSGLFCSATNSPLISTMTLDCTVTEFRDFCSSSSTASDKALNRNGEVYSETDGLEKGER